MFHVSRELIFMYSCDTACKELFYVVPYCYYDTSICFKVCSLFIEVFHWRSHWENDFASSLPKVRRLNTYAEEKKKLKSGMEYFLSCFSFSRNKFELLDSNSRPFWELGLDQLAIWNQASRFYNLKSFRSKIHIHEYDSKIHKGHIDLQTLIKFW